MFFDSDDGLTPQGSVRVPQSVAVVNSIPVRLTASRRRCGLTTGQSKHWTALKF